MTALVSLRVSARCVLVLVPTLVGSAVAGGNDASVVESIQSLDADIEYGEYLASTCSACHNPEAASHVIHGLDQYVIIEKLVTYRNGTLESSTMQSVAKGLADEEIAALAAYLSSWSKK